MKYLLIMLISTSLYAKIPEYLKGGKVTVKVKDGSTYTFDSEKMAVVPRGAKKKLVPTIIVQKQKVKKNRIFITGGKGPDNELEVGQTKGGYNVKADDGLVGGIGYQRVIYDDGTIGMLLQTNGTISIIFGKDF
jgi:hypothetical protein